MSNQTLSSGGRKYTPILKELVNKSICAVQCAARDIPTIMAGVKKEKVRWVRRNLWPKGKALKIDVEDEKLTFKMITDTSVNNL